MNKADHMDETQVRRYRQASDWLLRLNGEEPTEQDIADWLSWCEADSANLAAFERMRQDWRELEVFKLGRAAASPARGQGSPYRASRRYGRTLTVAAAWSLAGGLVLIGSMLAFHRWSQPPARIEVAAAGANKAATLPDGSSLVLSAKALVAVDFTGPQRRLALRTGEAYFKVRHDQARPFVVQVGAVTVTDVGTAFDVRQDDDHIIVTVEEGEVSVSAGVGRASQWTAGAGYQLVYSTHNDTATLASIDPAQVLKWRDGELAYVSAPLETVIADVNRYSSRRIVIRDPAVNRIHFTGTVFTASIDDWLKTVAATYPVRVTESVDGSITLESASPGVAAQ